LKKRKEPQIDKINLEISLKEYENKSIDMDLGSSLTPE